MVVNQSIFASVIIAFSIRFGYAEIIAIEEPWSTNSNYTCPPETTNSNNDSLTMNKICLFLCCPFGETRDDDNCIKENATLGQIKIGTEKEYMDMEVTLRNFHLATYDPCQFQWMIPSKVINFHVLKDRSINSLDSDGESISWDYKHYCLYKNSNSSNYRAKVCYPFVRKGWWEIFCAIMSLLVMLATFIAYTVVPELKNLHGMIFRSYVATYIATAVCVLAVEFTTEVIAATHWYIFFESGVRCWGCSCLLWVNVMSFNTWRSLRNVKFANCNVSKYEKEKYTWYAIYAWGIPAVLIAPGIIATLYIPYFRNETNAHLVKIWTSAIVITILYSSNVFLYISTSCVIRKHKNNTARRSSSVKKHHDAVEQWFNLYVKLFLIMGGHIIVWAIWLFWPTPEISHLLGTVETIQAILIFFIFVWKDTIKKSFYEQFQLFITSPCVT